MENLTPMMRQYMEIKNKHKDSILFFRLGDFYEMFFDDALTASRVLEITLTGKNCGLEERAPMCGIPFHSAEGYISKLVENGYKVAICEQVEDPQMAKGIVKRDVVKIITPGTVMDESVLLKDKNNYLLSITKEDKSYGLSYVDISTGELYCFEGENLNILEHIARLDSKEIIIDFEDEVIFDFAKRNGIYINKLESTNNDVISEIFSNDYICELSLSKLEVITLNTLLDYIKETQKTALGNILSIKKLNISNILGIDGFTRRNLELTETLRNKTKKGSLLHILDYTMTSMGARLLRNWVEEPLISLSQINERLLLVENFKNDYILREEIRECLSDVYDIERISSKIAYEKINPKELISLKESLKNLPWVKKLLLDSPHENLKEEARELDELQDIYKLIDSAILEEPSLTIKDGDIIKSEYSPELLELRNISQNSAQTILDIEAKEKERTGVKSLKIGFNKVFGYYIEITKANLKNLEIPSDYIRKQTLSNAERYISEELKVVEEKILHAKERIKDLEYSLFVDVRSSIFNEIGRIQKTASLIAKLDALQSLSTVAEKNNYCKPTMGNDIPLKIVEGRHPVIEKLLKDESFVPNDTHMDESSNIMLITGPNMAGKSTYMRQVALICLMAHMGSFVPADNADIPILDSIFTRVGASDDLSQGQSTFMVEMTEVSHILKNATKNSLIILDEIGRGTSTYDGLSLAWSIVEHISKSLGGKTLFATHYHELTILEENLKNLKNFSVAVHEDGEHISFLRKIVRGGADRSYGIHVARLAKVPEKVLIRASQILHKLENQESLNDKILKEKATDEYVAKKVISNQESQMSFDAVISTSEQEVISKLKDIDISRMTPLEAMNIIFDLQNRLRKE